MSQSFCITSVAVLFYHTHALTCSCTCMNALILTCCSRLLLSFLAVLILCLPLGPPPHPPAKLQSVGQHWPALVRGLPPPRQLGLPRQQLQLHPGGARGRGRSSCTRDQPSAPPQRTQHHLWRKAMRSTCGSSSGSSLVFMFCELLFN